MTVQTVIATKEGRELNVNHLAGAAYLLDKAGVLSLRRPIEGISNKKINLSWEVEGPEHLKLILKEIGNMVRFGILTDFSGRTDLDREGRKMHSSWNISSGGIIRQMLKHTAKAEKLKNYVHSLNSDELQKIVKECSSQLKIDEKEYQYILT